MDDPLSSLHDRPPRYLLESDSSDEEGQGIYPGAGPSRTKPKIALPEQDISVSMNWSKSTRSDIQSVVLGVGQTGKYLMRKTGLEVRGKGRISTGDKGDLQILMGGREVGRGYVRDGSLLLAMTEGLDEQSGLYRLAEGLIKELSTTSW